MLFCHSYGRFSKMKTNSTIQRICMTSSSQGVHQGKKYKFLKHYPRRDYAANHFMVGFL